MRRVRGVRGVRGVTHYAYSPRLLTLAPVLTVSLAEVMRFASCLITWVCGVRKLGELC